MACEGQFYHLRDLQRCILWSRSSVFIELLRLKGSLLWFAKNMLSVFCLVLLHQVCLILNLKHEEYKIRYIDTFLLGSAFLDEQEKTVMD